MTARGSDKDYPDSYYAATRGEPVELSTMDGDTACDGCVVGGGYTGLSAALHLAEQGYDVVLLEARRVGWGASGRNGGQLGGAHVVLQPDLADTYGEDRARALWRIAEDGKQLVKDLIARHEIACDYVAGHMGCAVTAGDLAHFEEHAAFVAKHYDYPHYRIYDRNDTEAIAGTARYAGALFDPTAGHLHPLNLALGLAGAARAAGARLYEMTPAESVDAGAPARVRTAGGTVTAAFVLLGCNGYLGGLAPEIAGTILPADNYQLATAVLPAALAGGLLTNDACLWDTHLQVYYYRFSRDRRLIFGGGLGFPGREPADMKAVVRRHMLKIFPQLADAPIDYAWGGTFCNTFDQLPHFGRLSDTVFYAHGYSGHGVALATLGGQLMAEVVAGTAERFDVLAGLPHRRFPGGPALRTPILAAGMAYVWLMDRLRG